jgi:hypothetical protein
VDCITARHFYSRTAPLCRCRVYRRAMNGRVIHANDFINFMERLDLILIIDEQSLNASDFYRAAEKISI